MGKEITRSDLIGRIERLAFGKSNDAVKLLFINGEDMELIDRLNLGMVAELKRSANGVVEVKLLNKLDMLRLLAELTDAGGDDRQAVESFFRAMDHAADMTGSGKNEV